MRRTLVVDPDDHYLFVSLGCVTENLVHAALANGLHGDARFDPTGVGAITVGLQATRATSPPLFQAILMPSVVPSCWCPPQGVNGLRGASQR